VAGRRYVERDWSEAPSADDEFESSGLSASTSRPTQGILSVALERLP